MKMIIIEHKRNKKEKCMLWNELSLGSPSLIVGNVWQIGGVQGTPMAKH